MNYVDVLLVLVVLLSIYASVQRGFILAALTLLSWSGSLTVGLLSYRPAGILLQNVFPVLNVWAVPLGFIFAVVIARIVLDTLADKITEKLAPCIHDHRLNKTLGVVPGIVNGLIWASFLAVFLLLTPVKNPLSEKAREGMLANKMVGKLGWLEDKLSPVFSEALAHLPSATTTIKVSKEEPVKLPYKVQNPEVRPNLESEMLVLVNRERTQRGLAPLKADPEIAVVARKHSVDMFARGYFSHYTPEGTDPFDRMRKDGVRFLTAGENLALAQTLAIAHQGLMNSPGHRANILNPAFGRLGIGILDGRIYGLMITQNFRN